LADTGNLLKQADAEAEALLGIVRMAVATTLGLAIYMALNSASRPESTVLNIQVLIGTSIIASYFLIGLAAFVVVRMGCYKMWMAWVTALLDVLLIAGSVFFSVINTGVGSLYALSFPSALMVPLVMTFGALRFRPSIQIATTVLMAVLLAMVLFLGPRSLDEQHAQYQLSITYGIAPNIMRVVMIMSVGFVVALAAWRAKRLLWNVAAEAEQRSNLTRFLPRGIADDMSDDALKQLRSGRSVVLAIMFVDIRGFTQMAEHMSPHETSRVLGDFRSHVLDIVDANGGIVDKFIGDGALILFGLKETPDRAANEAARAGTQLLERIEMWNVERRLRSEPEIVIGIGLHFGNVMVGAIGDERRLEFTVIGDEVNVASRVEQATKSLGFGLLATAPVIRDFVLGAAPEWEDLGEIQLPGHDAPVNLWGYSRSRR
jgi:adenylate cyclase